MQEARVELSDELFGDDAPTLLKLRLSRGYSQQQLASAVGTSQSHIAKIEAGALNVYWDTGERLAAALGVSLAEFSSAMHRTKARAETQALASGPTTRA
jgi:transcriptional regulator with XRE-family HTH domain